MATIALNKDKLNGIGGLIDDMICSLTKLDTKLVILRHSLQSVSSDTYSLQDSVDKISSSSKTEEEKIKEIEKFNNDVDSFIKLTTEKENAARNEINKRKNNFYSEYAFLKPDCEKNLIELMVGRVQTISSWCSKHWRAFATGVILVLSVALLITGVGTVLTAACWGGIIGAGIGGTMGGFVSLAQGKSFLQGFEKGAFEGAVGGFVGGAVAGAFSSMIGPSGSCAITVFKNIFSSSASSSFSEMVVKTVDCVIQNKSLEDGLGEVFRAGVSGAITGAFLGGILGKMSYSKSAFVNPANDARYAHLTVNETKALYRYTTKGYFNINNSLRLNANGTPLEVATPKNKIAIQNIKSALSKSKLPQDTVVYRRCHASMLKRVVRVPVSQMKGVTFENTAFTSTTFSKRIAKQFFSGSVIVKINAPKGCNALDISGLSSFRREKEILFNAGQKFLIQDVYKGIDGMLHLEMLAQVAN